MSTGEAGAGSTLAGSVRDRYSGCTPRFDLGPDEPEASPHEDFPGMTGLASELWSLVAVAVLVFFNGFFVAAEFALVSVRRTRIDELAAQGFAGTKVVKRAIRDLDRYIAGTQVGITLASLALGWIGEPALRAPDRAAVSHGSPSSSA